MSVQSEHIYELLYNIFPHNKVVKEHYVNFKGQQLFFDIYIKDYSLLFEIQGRQHSEYVKHFHVDKQGFLDSKKRDNLKIQYCQEKDICLVIINYDEALTSNELIDKINKCIK